MPANEKNDSKLKRQGRLLFTGLSMGLADLVPGVSGGTIALLYGIYDELLYSINVVTGKAPKLFLQGKFREAYRVIPFKFLIPVFLGIFTAIVSMVELFSFLLDNYPRFVWSLFFGLVIGSAIIVAKRVRKWTGSRYALLFFGIVITYIVVGLSGQDIEPNKLNLFGAGSLASAALVLPGISGSLILVLVGQYENVIQAVSSLDVSSTLFFAGGAVVGVALFARLLRWLLRSYHSGTIALMVGIMLGSLRRIWPWQREVSDHMYRNTLPEINTELLFTFALMIIGFVVVWQLEKLGVAEEHVDIEDSEFKHELQSQHD